MDNPVFKFIQGIVRLRGGTNNTIIGNSSDRLKVETTFPLDNYLSTPFGGLRTVQSENVFESLFSFDKQPAIWDEQLTGGATSVHDPNTNSIVMTLPTTNGASVIRQTFRRIRYNPSRTIQIFPAGVWGAPKVGIRRRIGLFDSLDGTFLETENLDVYVVRRSSTSGSTVDTRVLRANWNIDKFDGTGPSGVTLDFTKHQLIYSQYAFQGFGDIVYGFYANGRIQFCHRETVANILTAPSMRTAHLPCRVEFTNIATTASNTVMSYNSFSVRNEGQDSDREGQVLSYSSGAARTVGATVIPIISVRLRAGFERAIADLIKTTIYVTTAGDSVVWSVHAGATLTGATFAVNASYTQLDTAATAQSGGTELISGIVFQNDRDDISTDLLKFVNSALGVSIAGTPQIITLSARSVIGNSDVIHTIVWREYA